MAFVVKAWWVLSLLLWVSNLQKHGTAYGEPQVPCYFIFGDSLFDSGNNNFLVTISKVNYLPYGIDFPKGPRPTGRFSNGRNFADVIAELLGFRKYIPPFAIAIGREIQQGVNYASGGAGIRNETGQAQGQYIPMDKQLDNHRTIVSHIGVMLGSKDSAKKRLSKCIYTVDMGNNDYLSNYFLPQFFNTSREFTPEQYATVLAQQYSQQLKRLYDLGARKIAVIGPGLIGCTPLVLASTGTNSSSCVDNVVNNATKLFNSKLTPLVNDLNSNLTGAEFTFINLFQISTTSQGYRVANASCCKTNGQVLCIPFQTPCRNRTEYAYWDAVHPTEAAYVNIGRRMYSAQLPTDAQPYDISQLAELQ